MYRIKDSDNGNTLVDRTSAENALSWLEGQGETIATANEVLSKAREGVVVRSGAITVEVV